MKICGHYIVLDNKKCDFNFGLTSELEQFPAFVCGSDRLQYK